MSRKNKFKHKKSLGQNFLKNEDIIHQIIEVSDVKDKNIIEIGPGEGVLTDALAHSAKQVFAIELDDRLMPVLDKKFKSVDSVQIIKEDILHMNVEELVENNIGSNKYKVVANIPYYITAPIIRLFLELEHKPQEIVLMVQKEVGERLVAKPGQMSLLAVSAQYYADVEYLFTVLKENFDPMPKVDSAIIKLKIKNQKLKIGDVKNFFRVVKIGFSAKRKTLANNLSNGLQINKKEIEKFLTELKLNKNVRAQELSIKDWQQIVQVIKEILVDNRNCQNN